jgi:hypothetical protein
MTPSPRLFSRYLSTAEVAEITGVPRTVIADWLARGIISDGGQPGRGHRRKLSPWNAVEALLAAHINRLGVRAGDLKPILTIARMEASTSVRNCVLWIGFNEQGEQEWIERLTDDGFRPAEDEGLVGLTLNVAAAVLQVLKALDIKARRPEGSSD